MMQPRLIKRRLRKSNLAPTHMFNFDVVVNHVSVTYDVGVNMLLVLTRNYSRKNRKTKKKNFDTSYNIFEGFERSLF